jgi:hypothetical protein
MSTVQRTARLTGLAYLGLAVAGLLGTLLVREQLAGPGGTVTLAGLVEHPALARLGIVADLTVVLTQAAAALGFFALFRRVSSPAAGALAAFGLVNAVVILVACAFTVTAFDVAHAGAAASGDPAATVELLYALAGTAWVVGGLFFGLWLLPMGWLVVRSGLLPRALGWLLVAGGVGYVVGTYVDAVSAGSGGPWGALVLPATAGELWIVGYLLVKGVRDRTGASVDVPGGEVPAAA